MTGTDHDPPATTAGPDADVIAASWLAEAQQAANLAEIRDKLDSEARASWIDEAKAKERNRRRIEAEIRQRLATQPPPPAAPAPEPQRVQVHHSFDPQPGEHQSAGSVLVLVVRLIGYLIPIFIVLLLFALLIGSALLIDGTLSPTERARNEIADNEWTCDDVEEVDALTVDEDDVLWHWITPIGSCAEVGP